MESATRKELLFTAPVIQGTQEITVKSNNTCVHQIPARIMGFVNLMEELLHVYATQVTKEISVRLHLLTCVHRTRAVSMVIVHRMTTEGHSDAHVIQATKVASVRHPSTCAHRIPAEMVEFAIKAERDFIVHVGRSFYGRLCEFVVDLCSPNPCANNGICYQRGPKAHCRCQPGFHGNLCQIEATFLLSESLSKRWVVSSVRIHILLRLSPWLHWKTLSENYRHLLITAMSK